MLLASEAPTALIIRRGPSTHYCTIGWDRRTDEFTLGQWFKGRIDRHCCNLSPDGKHFIYLARKGGPNSETGGAWTALSKAPYLKAIGLWALGKSTYGCFGGHFIDNNRYWIQGYEKELRSPDNLVRADQHPYSDHAVCHCSELYSGGWKWIDEKDAKRLNALYGFQKRVSIDWILRKSSGDFTDYELVDTFTGKIQRFPDWEWADMDGERLVWCEKGKLWAAGVDETGLINSKVLYDFNPMVFEPRVAPY